MLVIGHRGAAGHEPENTLPSFEKAITLGVDMIEFDVHVCKSGEVVVLHDYTVDRTTNGHGQVADFTLETLQQLNAGKGTVIPTLAQALHAINRRARVNIELKGADTAIPTYHTVRKYINHHGWSPDDFLITSSRVTELERYRILDPNAQMGIIAKRLQPFPFAHIQRLNLQATSVPEIRTHKALITKLHRLGLFVYVYSYSTNPIIIKYLHRVGVDGICADKPEKI